MQGNVGLIMRNSKEDFWRILSHFDPKITRYLMLSPRNMRYLVFGKKAQYISCLAQKIIRYLVCKSKKITLQNMCYGRFTRGIQNFSEHPKIDFIIFLRTDFQPPKPIFSSLPPWIDTSALAHRWPLYHVGAKPLLKKKTQDDSGWLSECFGSFQFSKIIPNPLSPFLIFFKPKIFHKQRVKGPRRPLSGA